MNAPDKSVTISRKGWWGMQRMNGAMTCWMSAAATWSSAALRSRWAILPCLYACLLIGRLPAEDSDNPAESAGQALPGGTAGVAAIDAATPPPLPQLLSPIFQRTPQEMDQLLGSPDLPAAGAYDYPQYALNLRLLEAAAKLVQERGLDATSDFREGGKWYEAGKGRYLAIFAPDGRCLFDAAAPYRSTAPFQQIRPEGLFSEKDLGRSFWRFGFWRNPQTGAYERQIAACLPVRSEHDGPLLVCLYLSSQILPVDRQFAAGLCNEAAALVMQGGELAFPLFHSNATAGRFCPLPGMFIVVADENGTLLANSRSPAMMGRNLRLQTDAAGGQPLKQIVEKLKTGGSLWYSGDMLLPGRQGIQHCVVYVESVKHQEKRYLVGCVLLPDELTQARLAREVKQYDRLIRALAAAYADPFAPARSLRGQGLQFQGALTLPAGSGAGLEAPAALAALYGARLADFTYAAAFDEPAAALRTAEEADRVWRERLRMGDSVEALGSLSLVRLLDDTPQKPSQADRGTLALWQRILDNTLYGEVRFQTGLSVLYGTFLEELFTGSRLALTGKPERAAAVLQECQKQGRALFGLVSLGQELGMPEAHRLAEHLEPLREILLKEQLNPADLGRLREESARLRGELIRGN